MIDGHVGRGCAAAWLVLCLAALTGCGPGGPVRYPVAGTVTLDGQPLKDGYISFYSAGDDTSPDAGKVEAGAFSFASQQGNKRVEIVANRPMAGAAVDPAMGAAPLEQYIPAQYNTQTTLTAEVKPGENRFDFHLKSVP